MSGVTSAYPQVIVRSSSGQKAGIEMLTIYAHISLVRLDNKLSAGIVLRTVYWFPFGVGLLVQCQRYIDSASHGAANHWVVTDTEEAHHLYVGRY